MPGSANHFLRTLSTWFGLLSAALGLMIALAACGGGASASTTPLATTPTTVVSTPTASPASSTPTPTPTSQLTPVPGLTQMVMIVNHSDGSWGFTPATLTVKAGATITWKNVSSVPHTVTSDDGQTFDSGNVAPGGTYQFKFTTGGAFSYHCNIHPYMRAAINVV